MNEPEWLDLDLVLAFHAEQLALFGGGDGLRDDGLLVSALARPRNKWAYEGADLAALAAAYAHGIAANHPFIDGNKRTAFTALIVFLGLNGIAFAPPPSEATAAMLALASGEMDEAGLVSWIRERWPENAPA